MKLTNVVYLITCLDRKSRNELPYYYIGSKSNCTFNNFNSGKLFDKNGMEYWGSTKSNIIENEQNKKIEILYEFDAYSDALNKARELHKIYDVVANTHYINLAIATVNNFTDPKFGTFISNDTGKTVRLEIDHPDVISGKFKGVSSGYIWITDGTLSKTISLASEIPDGWYRGRNIDISGSNNPFFGKTHSKETIDIIKQKNSERVKTQAEIENWVNKVAKRKKSEDHKMKIGRKGMIMLKNIKTGESIRVKSDDSRRYTGEWVNPATYKSLMSKSKGK